MYVGCQKNALDSFTNTANNERRQLLHDIEEHKWKAESLLNFAQQQIGDLEENCAAKVAAAEARAVAATKEAAARETELASQITGLQNTLDELNAKVQATQTQLQQQQFDANRTEQRLQSEFNLEQQHKAAEIMVYRSSMEKKLSDLQVVTQQGELEVVQLREQLAQEKTLDVVPKEQVCPFMLHLRI